MWLYDCSFAITLWRVILKQNHLLSNMIFTKIKSYKIKFQIGELCMHIDMNHPVIAINVSLKFYQLQMVSGHLILLTDRIVFKSLKGTHITNVTETILFSEIKNLKMGLSFSPFRIAIIRIDGETWIFDQINRKDAKKFVELYHDIK